MAKFITFDNTTFHNCEKIDVISIQEEEKKSIDFDGDEHIYLSFYVSFDKKIVYSSDDYKISEGGYKTTTGIEKFISDKKQMSEQIKTKLGL